MDNDALSALLSDPEALQNAMKTVSGLFGGTPETEPSSSPAPADDPTGDMMARALPVISSVLQSGQAAVNPEKRALLARAAGRSSPMRSPDSSTAPSAWSAWREWRGRYSVSSVRAARPTAAPSHCDLPGR